MRCSVRWSSAGNCFGHSERSEEPRLFLFSSSYLCFLPLLFPCPCLCLCFCFCFCFCFCLCFCLCLCFCFGFGFGFGFGITAGLLAQRRGKPRRRPPLCRRRERSPKGEATDSIAVAVAVVFLLPFSAQKSHVKSKNNLTPTNKRKSSLKFSYTQFAILNIDKKQARPRKKIDSLRG
jgi:hypothetical protein